MLKAHELLNAGSRYNANGSVFWSQSTSGSLDIKSAYTVSKELYFSRSTYEAECSNQRTLKSFWKTLWKLPIPRKIKIFDWRLYHDALPAGHCLYERGLVESVQCCICGYSLETVAHALTGCWWAKSILQKLNVHHLDVLSSCHHPSDIIFYCWKYCFIREFTICLITLWFIWYNRNRVKHGDQLMDSIMAAHRVRSLMQQFCFYSDNTLAVPDVIPFS
ncbi:hypothetical protein QQ045_023397 [Rhodiola kirilowii]